MQTDIQDATIEDVKDTPEESKGSNLIHDMVASAALPLSPAGARLRRLNRTPKPLTEPIEVLAESRFVRRRTLPAIMGIFIEAMKGMENPEKGLDLQNEDHRARLVSASIHGCVYADKEATKPYFESAQEARAWAEIEDEEITKAVSDLFYMCVALNPALLQ